MKKMITLVAVGIALYLLFFPNPVTKAPIAPLLGGTISGETLQRVAGDSMAPAIGDGDMVSVRRAPFDTLKVDDMILIKNPGGASSIRRVVSVGSDGSLQAKSDNKINPERVTEGNYLGKVVKISHRDGTATNLP